MSNPEDIRKAARNHCEEVVLPQITDWEAASEYPRHASSRAAEAGLLGLYCPETYGGQELPFAHAIPALEELGRGSGLYAFSLSMHNIVGLSVSTLAQPVLRDAWAPRLISGAALGGFALTEPQSGSDASQLRTLAKIQSDGSYILSGRKAWVSLGGVADLFLVVAMVEDGGPAMVAVPANSEGLSFGEPYDKLVSPFMPIADMVLEQVAIPADNVIFPPGEGMRGSLGAIDIARTSIAAICCGMLSASLDIALSYARDRQLFGQSALSLQGIRWMLADIATDLEASRLLYQAAAERIGSPEGPVAAAHAKRFAPDAAVRGIGACLQVLGGYGLLAPYTIERRFREAPFMKIVDGTTEIQRVVIARALEKYADTLPDLPIPGEGA
jgi:alkylation response protein AidB-like acyl-CoA dehydrogenase